MLVGKGQSTDAERSTRFCFELPLQAGQFHGLMSRDHSRKCVTAYTLHENCRSPYR